MSAKNIMGRVEVWESLPSFEIEPSKTFFGLDKNQSHCFTLPKEMTDCMIRFFGLREGKLQTKIQFQINGKQYPAIVRWARLDRRKPTKLEKGDLPKRDIIQFQWKGNLMTVSAMRILLQESYLWRKSQSGTLGESVIFIHKFDNVFIVQTNIV